jgi:hypothetical protein
MPTIPSEIDWNRLSEMGAWRMLHIAWPISSGLSRTEVAAQTGESVVWVATQLELLRDELERVAVENR